MKLKVYDYVIAGGGSAGCTIAARLCEDPDVSVLLIESGGNGRSLFTRMPAGNGILIGNKKFDWGYESTPQPGMNGGKVYYPRGRGLGGSSLLNGMIYIRGNAADYDDWASKGLEGWSYADVLPYFKRSAAADHRPGDPFHDTTGPMKLSPARNFERLSKQLMQACIEAGAPLNDDFNGHSQLGVGRLDAKTFEGIRQSSAEAYLVNQPSNLTIQTDCHVLSVEFEGLKAVGLKLSDGRVRAEREVILCMGAFGSPQTLMLSGIGPAQHLKQHAIDVRVDLPGVGSRLYDHPNMPIQYGIQNAFLSMARFQRVDRAIVMGLKYLLNRSGPGGGPFWSVVLFHALQNRQVPELEVFFTPMLVREEAGGGGWNIKTLMNPGRSVIARGKMAEPGVQLDVNLLRPRSFGTVRLASTDPRAMPVVDPGYLSHPDDVKDLIAGVRHMREVVRQPAMEKFISTELSPGPDEITDKQIEASIRRLITTGHHPVCTCAMGIDSDPLAVLDNKLRVRGVENLRVVDGSSFPNQINGNVNAPIIMMAEKASDLLLGKPALPPFDPRLTNKQD